MTLLLLTALTFAADPLQVFPPDQPCRDTRLGKPLDLNGYFPFTPPPSRDAWEQRRQQLREQLLVANGLWPLPPKTPLQPVIHSPIRRDGYTVEKVFFASMPGHYVTGNLYRPTAATPEKRPAVLSPHGHWPNGRFVDVGQAKAEKDVAAGAENSIAGARYPLQARCAQLARMGCVVFHYDMVGYADSTVIGHRAGFTDAEAELRLQSFLGLQTWNSIRALDFLLALPDVDTQRVGVTGASGGGTQTFLLCALDDRPTAAFPAVMVSTAMQGGCICENCSYLRIGTGNVELAGLFAPKPLAMSAANDWTRDIETKGLPQLKSLYALYGAEDRVAARCWPEFGHNYNQRAREMMYGWFNRHLQLGLPEPIAEQPFEPIPPDQLRVFDAKHPLPADAQPVETLRQGLTQTAETQLAALTPRDAASLTEYRRVIGTALRVMLLDSAPAAETITATDIATSELEGVQVRKLTLSRQGAGEHVPAVWLRGPKANGPTIIWAHPEGKKSLLVEGKLVPAARAALERGATILAIDTLRTGELTDGQAAPAVNGSFAGFTFGYNKPLLAQRVHDLLTAAGYARTVDRPVHFAGWEQAGLWTVLARAAWGQPESRVAADLAGQRFGTITDVGDPLMLPGALKYGDWPGLAALIAPGEAWLSRASGPHDLTTAAYQAAGAADRLRVSAEPAAPKAVIDWLLR